MYQPAPSAPYNMFHSLHWTDLIGNCYGIGVISRTPLTCNAKLTTSPSDAWLNSLVTLLQ